MKAILFSLLVFSAIAQGQQTSSCGVPPTGKNFSGKVLNHANFAYQDLTGANFSGATLKAASFIGANLTRANFQNALFLNDTANSFLSNDFSMANLTSTCFQGAKFSRTTYFTFSTLTCADFSQTDISVNPVFGQSPLNFDRSANACRPSFRAATMSCEFINDWESLDLSRANVRSCLPVMANRKYSYAMMAEVDFTGADLDGAQFDHATLTKARFTSASLQKADLSYAKLQGASLDFANLTGANLYDAFLSNDTEGKVESSATARQAHFKNVNLAFATLSGVDFSYANFYGTVPAGPGSCATEQGNYQGFTKNCATAHSATLSGTNFTNAYLYGVDFSDASFRGVTFSQAILAGTNLTASFGTNTFTGTRTSFFRSFLQGAHLGNATITDSVSTSDAFLDFRPGGNILDIYLSGANHNQFVCKNCDPPTGTDVCVETYYLTPSTVSTTDTNLSCPDNTLGPCGAPDPSGSNTHWKSPLLARDLPPQVPTFWYLRPPTYPPSWSIQKCNGKAVTFDW